MQMPADRLIRHPELVSGSIPQSALLLRDAASMLKRVQHDILDFTG